MVLKKWKKRFTWNEMQNSFTHKKSFSCEKCIVTSVLSVLQKLKVAKNSVTILGYSNDKNIYIARNIISID